MLIATVPAPAVAPVAYVAVKGAEEFGATVSPLGTEQLAAEPLTVQLK